MVRHKIPVGTTLSSLCRQIRSALGEELAKADIGTALAPVTVLCTLQNDDKDIIVVRMVNIISKYLVATIKVFCFSYI
jgi:hypothetical protein